MVVKMAEAARWGGAVGIRANSPEQIKKIKEAVPELPMIGLWKIWHDDTDVFITPTMKEVRAIWEAGAEIIALDCTAQITHEGKPAWDLIKQVKQEIPEAIVLRMFQIMKRRNAPLKMGRISWRQHCMAIQRDGAYRRARHADVRENVQRLSRRSVCDDGRAYLYARGRDEVYLFRRA